MSSQTEVRVPDIGDFTDVEVIEVHVSTGDRVAAEDPLITLETDKASMDVPAPAAGVVQSLDLKAGDKVSQGSLILRLEVAEEEDKGAVSETEVNTGPTESTPGAEAAAGATTSVVGDEAGDEPEGKLGGDTEVRVPDIGDFRDVDVIEVHVSAGDQVAGEDPLITLETDKAAMDVPAPAAGTVKNLSVKAGDKVSEGDLILTLNVAATAPSAPAARPAEKTQAAADAGPSKTATMPRATPTPATPAKRGELPPIDEQAFSRAHASPAVRRFARELGVDLGQVSGTGSKGRIINEDVKAFVKAVMSGQQLASAAPALPAVPEVDFAKYGEIEVQALSRIQKISGPRLHASWINLPHVTQFDQADITELEERRQTLKGKAEKQGARLTPLAFLVVACVKTLKEFPKFNTSLDPSGESLVYKKYFHIGFAADTPNGLVVPVIKNADQKSLLQIARELAELSARARDGKLPATDMQGGTFTISSLGGIGGTAFTPIINAPEVAILGVSRSQMQPVYEQGAFVPRLMLPLCLSYDHRIIDGASAARFTTFLSAQLADPDGLILN
ncbi:MAG: dihydrolipoyllysine-residue acetyltransferase [Gammaproteobacteria bacterium]